MKLAVGASPAPGLVEKAGDKRAAEPLFWGTSFWGRGGPRGGSHPRGGSRLRPGPPKRVAARASNRQVWTSHLAPAAPAPRPSSPLQFP